MSEKLADLPTVDTKLSEGEQKVIERYFGESDSNMSSQSNTTSTTTFETLKLVGYSTILFALLANPWGDGLIQKLPYIGMNAITIFVFKLVLFALLFFVVFKILV